MRPRGSPPFLAAQQSIGLTLAWITEINQRILLRRRLCGSYRRIRRQSYGSSILTTAQNGGWPQSRRPTLLLKVGRTGVRHFPGVLRAHIDIGGSLRLDR